MKTSLSILALSLLLTACASNSQDNVYYTEESLRSSEEISPNYTEHLFDLGDDSDMGFTKRAFEQWEDKDDLLSEGYKVLENSDMTFDRLSEQDHKDGILERRIWNGDVYELTKNFRMLKNGDLLFKENMDFWVEGPIEDWRVVDEKPAFTYLHDCKGGVGCSTDIWYDGSLISETFSVENPRYLFSYNGKLGFVATNEDQESIFYDGQFITRGFTTIWTHNCCSYTEILPTVYENGTLLFFAKRGEDTYLVETSL